MFHFHDILLAIQVNSAYCGKKIHKGVKTRRPKSLAATLEDGYHNRRVPNL